MTEAWTRDRNRQISKAERKFNTLSTQVQKEFPGWKKIVKDLEGMGYFAAPASKRFHLSVRSGLLIHSVAVTLTMLKFAKGTRPRIPRWKMIMAGLIHDSGKCGLYGFEDGTRQPRYLPTSGEETKYFYKYSSQNPNIHLRDLSGLYAARWKLPWDVVQAILVHDGMYVPSNRPYAHKMSPLAMLIMVADTWTGQVEEDDHFTYMKDLAVKPHKSSREETYHG